MSVLQCPPINLHSLHRHKREQDSHRLCLNRRAQLTDLISFLAKVEQNTRDTKKTNSIYETEAEQEKKKGAISGSLNHSVNFYEQEQH